MFNKEKSEFKAGVKQIIQESKLVMHLTVNATCLIAGFIAGAIVSSTMYGAMNYLTDKKNR